MAPSFSLMRSELPSIYPPMFTQQEAIPTVSRVEHARDWPKWMAFLLAGFFLLLLPIIPSAAKFHGDERYYTDAALIMVQTGDYWTPRYADGEIRLLKPILTYWAAAGSFQILGINLFAARLPFLIAAVLLLYFTWRLAQTILRRDDLAFFAALILASNIAVMTLSTRATPDVLVCLFMLMSTWGFARVWFENGKTFWAPLLAFAGIGLAIQTKGLLGLSPLAANLLFWLVTRPDRTRLKALLNWPAIAIGISIAVFWYWVMLHRHGLGAMQDFYADQVGAKISRNPGFVVGNLAVYLFGIVRHFLPWTLIALIGVITNRRAIKTFWEERREQCIFLLALVTVLLVVFACGSVRRTRYLTAGYPMLSIFLAGTLSCFSMNTKFTRPLLNFLSILMIIAGTGLAIVGMGAHWLLASGGAALILTGVAGLLCTDKQTRVMWIGAVCLVGFAVLGTCIRPVFSPAPLAAAVEQLKHIAPKCHVVHAWKIPSTSPAGQLRMISCGTLAVETLNTNASPGEIRSCEMILTVAPHQLELASLGFSLHQVTTTNRPFARTWLGRRSEPRAEKAHKKGWQSYWLGWQPSANAGK